MALRGSQRQILQAIVNLRQDQSRHVQDSQIFILTKISLDDVRDWLFTLEDDGLVIIARSEIGLGVYETAKGRLELKKAEARFQPSEGGPDKGVLKVRDRSKIGPKGLRSFDKEDADFFLELLPGPYNREGLPESIWFWKVRIDGTDPDRSFPVGMIYGPSGSGKSSLIKAGLLPKPRLPDHVMPIYVEATTGETESQLLKLLRKRYPDLPLDLGLADSLDALRQSPSLPPGMKVLLVIDQFEQWLVGRRGESGKELVKVLRHCDEERVQAILLVRDDYLSAAIQFMQELGVEFRPSRNARRVDLFGRAHAKKVLAAFGQSYGVLGDDLTPDQQSFLKQAVDGLAREGIVIPVRLALFAEMLKGRDWTPKTLQEIGGAEGVGAAFLEETFNSTHADPRHRAHQQAARSILTALLPQGGEDMKGPRRSKGELLKESGHAFHLDKFENLIKILDDELRLITPSAPEGLNGEDLSTSPLDQTHYQLTHDYLVPSIREWLVRKQKETRRGRSEIRLAEHAVLWGSKRMKHLLPRTWEYVLIRCFTDRRAWTTQQRAMMHAARKKFLCRTLLWFTVLAFALMSGYQAYLWNRARKGVDALVLAEDWNIHDILRSIRHYRGWADPMLESKLVERDGLGNLLYDNSINIHLASIQQHPERYELVRDRLLAEPPWDIRTATSALARQREFQPFMQRLVDDLWQIVEESNAKSEKQILRAACSLTYLDTGSPRWRMAGRKVALALVSEDAYFLGPWLSPFWNASHAVELARHLERVREQSGNRAVEEKVDYIKRYLQIRDLPWWQIPDIVSLNNDGSFTVHDEEKMTSIERLGSKEAKVKYILENSPYWNSNNK